MFIFIIGIVVAVSVSLHYILSKSYSELPHFDTVRGCFTEGKRYLIQKFMNTHILICIRNLNCIKGFFLSRNLIKFP